MVSVRLKRRTRERTRTMNFRLTIGENNTPWGKQKVIYEGKAKNAVDFARFCKNAMTPNDQKNILKNAWIDAGNDTLPIAVQNLIF